jgi:hypothetical protein
MRRWLKFAATGFGLIVYLWVAAVKNVDAVKKRKRSRRSV